MIICIFTVIFFTKINAFFWAMLCESPNWKNKLIIWMQMTRIVKSGTYPHPSQGAKCKVETSETTCPLKNKAISTKLKFDPVSWHNQLSRSKVIPLKKNKKKRKEKGCFFLFVKFIMTLSTICHKLKIKNSNWNQDFAKFTQYFFEHSKVKVLKC